MNLKLDSDDLYFGKYIFFPQVYITTTRKGSYRPAFKIERKKLRFSG